MALGRLPEEGGDETQAVFSEINITPLTDIFLVLLIIFMVGASMAVESAASGGERSGMQIDLPRGSAKDLSPSTRDVAVVVLPDGRVVVGGEEVADDELEASLARAFAESGSPTLIVQADEGVAHGRVVAVMEAARAAGFTRLAVATRGD